MLYALDLSGALDTEALREDLPAEELSVISCRDIEGTTCYCDDEAACAIRTRIAPLPWRALHWIDSGDYHYLTALWCEKADTPFDLLLFDHHTDMQQPRYGEILSCGSWLLEMLRHNAMLRRAVIVGAAENLRCETLPLSGRVTMISEEECRGASAPSAIRESPCLYTSPSTKISSPRSGRRPTGTRARCPFPCSPEPSAYWRKTA